MRYESTTEMNTAAPVRQSRSQKTDDGAKGNKRENVSIFLF
jgi:hypothetical protein